VVKSGKRRTDEEMSGDNFRGETQDGWKALAQRPDGAGDAAPPSPKRDPIDERRKIGDGVAFAGGDHDKNCREREDHRVGIEESAPVQEGSKGRKLGRKLYVIGTGHDFPSPTAMTLELTAGFSGLMDEYEGLADGLPCGCGGTR
jgi:hypothetical protein